MDAWSRSSSTSPAGRVMGASGMLTIWIVGWLGLSSVADLQQFSWMWPSREDWKRLC